MFVLGVLIVLAALVTGASLANRQRLASVSAEKSLFQTHLSLQGALQAVMAKLSLDSEMAAILAKDPSAGRGLVKIPEPWRASEGAQHMELDGNLFEIRIAQATWFPDANALSDTEWARLLVELGVQQEGALALGQRLVTKRDLLRRGGSGKGFVNYHQIFDGMSLPPSVLFGNRVTGETGLIDLISLGTDSKETDPMFTPWVIYRALYNATESHIKRLQAKRDAGQLTKAQEAEILGMAAPAQPTQPSPTPVSLLKVVAAPAMSTDTPASSISLQGVVKIQAGTVSLQTEYLFFRE